MLHPVKKEESIAKKFIQHNLNIVKNKQKKLKYDNRPHKNRILRIGAFIVK